MPKEKKAKRMPKKNPIKFPENPASGLDPRMFNSAGEELVRCHPCSALGQFWEWVDDEGKVHHRRGRNQHMREGGKRQATKVKCHACKGAGVIVKPLPAEDKTQQESQNV